MFFPILALVAESASAGDLACALRGFPLGLDLGGAGPGFGIGLGLGAPPGICAGVGFGRGFGLGCCLGLRLLYGPADAWVCALGRPLDLVFNLA